MRLDPADSYEPGDALKYRIPAVVSEVRVFQNHDAFPVCPNCRITLEREYQAFCDRCGQALDWSMLADALIVFR